MPVKPPLLFRLSMPLSNKELRSSFETITQIARGRKVES